MFLVCRYVLKIFAKHSRVHEFSMKLAGATYMEVS